MSVGGGGEWHLRNYWYVIIINWCIYVRMWCYWCYRPVQWGGGRVSVKHYSAVSRRHSLPKHRPVSQRCWHSVAVLRGISDGAAVQRSSWRTHSRSWVTLRASWRWTVPLAGTQWYEHSSCVCLTLSSLFLFIVIVIRVVNGTRCRNRE